MTNVLSKFIMIFLLEMNKYLVMNSHVNDDFYVVILMDINSFLLNFIDFKQSCKSH